MAKNLVSVPILTKLFPALPKNFFWSFVSGRYYALLQAVIAYNFKENYKTKVEKMATTTTTTTTTKSFETNFGTFGPNLGAPIFFRGFYLYQMLDINASYHCIQFQGKLMKQT